MRSTTRTVVSTLVLMNVGCTEALFKYKATYSVNWLYNRHPACSVSPDVMSLVVDCPAANVSMIDGVQSIQDESNQDDLPSCSTSTCQMSTGINQLDVEVLLSCYSDDSENLKAEAKLSSVDGTCSQTLKSPPLYHAVGLKQVCNEEDSYYTDRECFGWLAPLSDSFCENDLVCIFDREGNPCRVQLSNGGVRMGTIRTDCLFENQEPENKYTDGPTDLPTASPLDNEESDADASSTSEAGTLMRAFPMTFVLTFFIFILA